MFAFIASTPGFIVQIKENRIIKKFQVLKLKNKHHLALCAGRLHMSSNIHSLANPNLGIGTGHHPSIIHLQCNLNRYWLHMKG